MHLYTWANPLFGRCFGPMILFWMNLFYGGRLRRMTPCRLARSLKMPVMLIHGEQDRRFPVRFAYALKACFREAPVSLYVAPGAGHSDASRTPGYLPAVRAFLERHHALPASAADADRAH